MPQISINYSKRSAVFFKPLIWCGKQWSKGIRFSKDCKLSSIVKRIIFLVPLIIASLASIFLLLPGLFFCGKTITNNNQGTQRPNTIIGFSIVKEQNHDLGSSAPQLIKFSGPGNVSIIHGSSNSLRISAEENLLPLLKTTFNNNELDLNINGCFDTNIGIHYKLTVTAPPSHLIVSGAGDIEIDSVIAPQLICTIKGCGDVKVHEGQVDRLEINVLGSGDYKGRNLKSNHAEVSIEGSGDVTVHVIKCLLVEIKGGGDCFYTYSSNLPPTICKDIYGTGSVKQV